MHTRQFSSELVLSPQHVGKHSPVVRAHQGGDLHRVCPSCAPGQRPDFRGMAAACHCRHQRDVGGRRGGRGRAAGTDNPPILVAQCSTGSRPWGVRLSGAPLPQAVTPAFFVLTCHHLKHPARRAATGWKGRAKPGGFKGQACQPVFIPNRRRWDAQGERQRRFTVRTWLCSFTGSR